MASRDARRNRILGHIAHAQLQLGHGNFELDGLEAPVQRGGPLAGFRQVEFRPKPEAGAEVVYFGLGLDKLRLQFVGHRSMGCCGRFGS